MVENLKIYHNKHREGTIIKYEDGIYEIDFNGEIRKIYSGQWAKSLFLNAKDAFKKQEELDITLYAELIDMDNNALKLIEEKKQKNKSMNIKPKLYDQFWVDDEEVNDSILTSDYLDSRALLSELMNEMYMNIDVSTKDFSDENTGDIWSAIIKVES